jgi:hypothetical protein
MAHIVTTMGWKVNQNVNVSPYLVKFPGIKLNENPLFGYRIVACEKTDMSKLIER